MTKQSLYLQMLYTRMIKSKFFSNIIDTNSIKFFTDNILNLIHITPFNDVFLEELVENYQKNPEETIRYYQNDIKKPETLMLLLHLNDIKIMSALKLSNKSVNFDKVSRKFRIEFKKSNENMNDNMDINMNINMNENIDINFNKLNHLSNKIISDIVVENVVAKHIPLNKSWCDIMEEDNM